MIPVYCYLISRYYIYYVKAKDATICSFAREDLSFVGEASNKVATAVTIP